MLLSHFLGKKEKVSKSPRSRMLVALITTWFAFPSTLEQTGLRVASSDSFRGCVIHRYHCPQEANWLVVFPRAEFGPLCTNCGINYPAQFTGLPLFSRPAYRAS